MNKKLRLLGYLFNTYPFNEDHSKMDGYSMMEYLLKEDGVLKAIYEIIQSQQKSLNISLSSNLNYYAFGDTVSNVGVGWVNNVENSFTLGNTTLTEDDLIKIKKNNNIT
jgi:hypothetical protein